MPTALNTAPAELWLRRFHSTADGRVRLFCFPHAGGAASYYFPFSQTLAPEIEVVAVQYPGRQERRREPRIESIAGLADAVTAALDGQLDRPYAFFGHSMGAIVAFEVAYRLLASSAPPPLRLFASGRRAPSTRREESVHLRDDAGVVAELKRLGGTDQRFLEDEEILALALPPTRSDYKAVETYRFEPRPPLDVPISVLSGRSDPQTTPQEIAAWVGHSTTPPDFHAFPGGHFFLDGCRDEVAETIRAAVRTDRRAL